MTRATLTINRRQISVTIIVKEDRDNVKAISRSCLLIALEIVTILPQVPADQTASITLPTWTP